MVVTFCGHAEIASPNIVHSWLKKAMEDLILEGAETFYLGGYGDFDRLAAAVVLKMKRQYPHIESVLVLPYLDCKMNTDGYDTTIYPPLETVPRRFAISRRNKWMVDKADVILAYVTHDWGGAAKTLAYAKRKNKKIILYTNQTFA